MTGKQTPMTGKQAPTPVLPEVAFSDFNGVRYLHLGSEWVQGSMWLERPLDIHLEYVQRMMAGLLFLDSEGLNKRHAMQLGLGSGALTKFCRRVLRMPTTAIEINPAVYQACRTWFKLPAQDSRLNVVLADAQSEIRKPHWQGVVDLLHVDLYDHEAACPVLDSQAFYADCRNLLSEDGNMTVNLFGRRASFDESLRRIGAVFGTRNLWTFKPTREGNQVVLAQRQLQRPTRGELLRRADEIEADSKLPARKWLRSFQSLHA